LSASAIGGSPSHQAGLSSKLYTEGLAAGLVGCGGGSPTRLAELPCHDAH